MSAPLDRGAYGRPARRPHAWKAVDRLSTWEAFRPSGLWSRERLVSPASILLEMDRGDAVADDHCVTDRCLPTPPTRRRMQFAALMGDPYDGPSGIAMILMTESQALDPCQDHPPRYLQVALAAAGQGHRGRRHWGRLDCPS